MSDSISRRFARWAEALQFEDLPPAVIDKVKGFVLFQLVSAAVGMESEPIRRLVDFVATEEAKADGAPILGDGIRVNRSAAAYANCEIMHFAGLFDSFRMITHPGPVLVAVALTNAAVDRGTGRDLVTAIAAGYEFECRLAEDFVPSTGARGYRPAPIFSTMGAAMVTAKQIGLDENALVSAIAVATSSASGLNVGSLTGGGEAGLQELISARQGIFAALLARSTGVTGSELSIEGDAGFFYTYAGSKDGHLSYSYTGGPRSISLDSVTDDLGSTWRLLDVMFRMYKCGGYNAPVIDLLATMRSEFTIDPREIEEVVIELSYLETTLPSPDFRRDPDHPTIAAVGSTHYFASHVLVNGGYPVIGGATFGPTGTALTADEAVLEFMSSKVRIIGVYDHPMISPRITIRMMDGTAHVKDWPYEQMLWDYDGLVDRLQRCVPGIPGGKAKLDALVALVDDLEMLDSVDPIFEAMSR